MHSEGIAQGSLPIEYRGRTRIMEPLPLSTPEVDENASALEWVQEQRELEASGGHLSVYDPKWRDQAECKDPDKGKYIFPRGITEGKEARKIREERAKAICRTCKVIDACREDALVRAVDPNEIAGGMNSKEIKFLRRDRDLPTPRRMTIRGRK